MTATVGSGREAEFKADLTRDSQGLRACCHVGDNIGSTLCRYKAEFSGLAEFCMDFEANLLCFSGGEPTGTRVMLGSYARQRWFRFEKLC